jgi:hypothetical protein
MNADKKDGSMGKGAVGSFSSLRLANVAVAGTATLQSSRTDGGARSSEAGNQNFPCYSLLFPAIPRIVEKIMEVKNQRTNNQMGCRNFEFF